jgi:hypothetical protein
MNRYEVTLCFTVEINAEDYNRAEELAREYWEDYGCEFNDTNIKTIERDIEEEEG